MLNVEFMIVEYSAEDLGASSDKVETIRSFSSVTAWQQQTRGARREPTANVLVHEETSAGIHAADSPVCW